jgi:hypothetical protein
VKASWITSTAAVLAALVVGNLINSHLQVNSEQLEPFVEAGEAGQVTHLTYGDVEVTDVRPAAYVVPQVSTELARQAGGVFLLVSVKVTAAREPTTFLAAYLEDAEGRQYRSSPKAECAINVESGTGVPAYALFCFDVPPRQLAGMRLQLSRGNLVYSTLAGDHLADIDLNISDADEQTWRHTEAAYLAETTTWEPFELQSITLEQAPT